MNVVYLITEKYLKDNSELQNNCDMKKVLRNILIAQRVFILDSLGTILYNKIIADYDADTLTGLYSTLVEEYIQPTLVQYTMYKSLPFLKYSFTNKSVVSKNADNVDSVELSELKYIQNQYKQSGDEMLLAMKKYIIEEYSNGNFPEFGENEDLDEQQPNRENPNLYGGLYLGDSISRGTNIDPCVDPRYWF